MKNPEIKQSYKQTMLKKYGTEWFVQTNNFKASLPKILEKIDRTKTIKNTHNTSKPEKVIYQLLTQKFGQVKHPYKTQEYPFKCDFYIPCLDLYIEYQGTWRHGKRPFDIEDSECLKLRTKWMSKARTSENYLNALNVWTVRDVIKRQTAKENNLNWLEFFNMNDFMEWYNNIW